MPLSTCWKLKSEEGLDEGKVRRIWTSRLEMRLIRFGNGCYQSTRAERVVRADVEKAARGAVCVFAKECSDDSIRAEVEQLLAAYEESSGYFKSLDALHTYLGALDRDELPSTKR